MKRAARLFLFIGIGTIALAVYDFTQVTPYLDLLPKGSATHIILSMLVWLGIGITEIAVGWLIHKETTKT